MKVDRMRTLAESGESLWAGIIMHKSLKASGIRITSHSCPRENPDMIRTFLVSGSTHRISRLRDHRVGHSPLREHSVKTVSEDAWQHDRIELVPLNPDYDPILVAPHEGSEMVVVGEWVASID